MAAYKRIVRVKSLAQGATPTAIAGAVGASWSAEAAGIKRAESDSDIGFTSISITGWKASAKITLDQYVAALTLAALATAPFQIGYDVIDSVSGVVSGQTAAIGGVCWGTVADFNVPAANTEGGAAQYTVSGDVVIAAANVLPSSFVTIS